MEKSNLDYHIKFHTGENQYQCSLCQQAFVLKCTLQHHNKTHTGDCHRRTCSGEKSKMCFICHKTFAWGLNLKIHMKSHIGEKYCSVELCRVETENHIVDSLAKTAGINTDFDNCVDGKVFPTAETLPEIPLRQFINPGPDEKLCSLNQSIINVHVDDFVLRPYGCGYCDEVFEFEKAFVEHSYNHYFDAPQKDTFLELIEVRLLT